MIYLKLPSTTQLYQDIMAWENKRSECIKTARQFLQKHSEENFEGAELQRASRGHDMGGVYYVVFPWDMQPLGWVAYDKKKNPGLHYPKASNKKLLKSLIELPTVDKQELINMLGWKYQFVANGNGGLNGYEMPSIAFHDEYILFKYPEGCTWDAPVDAVEITYSQYKELDVDKEA